jgi:AcrR family transcriptional regulator
VTRSVNRSYDNERRAAQSLDTERRILETARQQLVSKGYRATTIALVARAAGVHHDTIYNLVGRKPEILRELIVAASGSARRILYRARGRGGVGNDQPTPRANMRRLVVDLGEVALRPGLSVDTAADVIWATASSEVFLLLTSERRWSLEQYEAWLHDTWCRLVLVDD